jgi:membrane protease YdiL (CAAX protease family)
MEQPKRRTLLFQWLGDFLVCLLVATPLSIPAAIMSRPERGAYPASWIYWSSMLAASCGMGATAFFRLKRVRRSLALPPELSTTMANGWWMWLLLAVAALPVLRLMQSALLRVLNIGPGEVDPIATALFQTRGWALGLAGVALVVAGPISEELLYRGLLLGRFRKHGYLVSGTLISTIVFMVSHRDPRQYLELCGAGLLLAGLYRRTNSLWTPIALHALNNGWETIQAILSRPS